MAHVLNLIGASMSKHHSIKPILKQLNELVLTINRNKKLLKKIRKLGGSKPVQIVPTRWYSTNLTIKSILKIKEDLEQVPPTREFGYERWGLILEDRTFLSNLRQLDMHFGRLTRSTCKRSSSNCAETVENVFDYL